MKYFAGVDIGTSGTKTVIFDENFRRAASASEEYPLYQPQNGFAEQEPSDWWRAVAATLKAALGAGGIEPREVAGVGLSGQMHGLVMLGASGEVLRRSIIWCDQRTGRQCGEITERVGARRLIEITANPALTGFTASKILWVRENEPELYAACRHILLPKDYIRYMLTGEFATEVSDASGMQLLDVPGRRWSDEVLCRLEIDGALLGRVYESPEVTGVVTREAAALTGLEPGTPVVGGAGDNAAAAVGTGVVEEGRAFTTIGTSGVVFAHMPRPAIDPAGRVHTFCCAVPGEWHIMGVTQAAGLSLKWFRDNFCSAEVETAAGLGVDSYVLTDKQAQRVPIGADGLLWLPYLMGERTPHLDADARGVFFGLSAVHTKAHMLRAVMEGVSYSLRDCLCVLRELGVSVGSMAACGGGGKSPFWRQMLADVYDCPVSTVAAGGEAPALGAAILAAVGAGAYPDVRSACEAAVECDSETIPDAASSAEYMKYYGIYKGIYPALRDSFAALRAI